MKQRSVDPLLGFWITEAPREAYVPAQ